MCAGFGWDEVNFLHFWVSKQGSFLKDQCLSLLKRHPPHLLLVLHCGSDPGFTLKQFSSDMSCSALRWYAASRSVREDWEARRPPVAPLLFSDRYRSVTCTQISSLTMCWSCKQEQQGEGVCQGGCYTSIRIEENKDVTMGLSPSKKTLSFFPLHTISATT